MSRKWESIAFWAQEAEMTLTLLCSLESARKKFFMNLTYIMSRKWESNVFGLRVAEMTLTPHLFARIGEKTIFDQLDVHHV